MNNEKKTIIVTGDVTMDWNLARMRRSKGDTSFWCADDNASTTWQRGGSALMADLTLSIANELNLTNTTGYIIRQTGAPQSPGRVMPDSDLYHHSFASWAPFKFPQDKEKPAWRVEEFLGLDRADDNSIQEWQKVVDDTPTAHLILLDDANLGFRDCQELWPAALQNTGKDRPWVLLKMARPLAQGQLWKHLHRNFSDRLIVVASVDDLRLSEVQISQALSWERTSQDVFWELVHNPCVNSLSNCAHVIISFGPAGAILLSRQEKKKGSPGFQCMLFFDPKVIEKMWEKDYPGGMVGYTTCLTAGITRQLMLSTEQPDISLGIQSGLSAIRNLHVEGYGERGLSFNQTKLAFPRERIASVLANPVTQFAVVQVEDPVRYIQQNEEQAPKPRSDGFWTILQDKFKSGLNQVAMQVVLEGPEVALKDVPWGQFGNLLTVDRQEIESFRSISNLVSEYAGQKSISRPLSIAVFGTPGSGKSFGITEMTKSLLPGQIEPITFNLSQFDSSDGLISALHQVRDIGLNGRIPLVFWDEFDTSLNDIALGWLRYFLAPMQDGKFQEGQINHPIGRAIFVFAGGTSASMDEFNKGTDSIFKSAKGPDFISRLKGFINVLGPNPVKEVEIDPYFIIRRAILLRSSLKRSLPPLFTKVDKKELLNIDNGVLRAMLKIGTYKHGARSIESIFSMSQLTGKTSFERSCLPPESQLDLHVDGKFFLSLVQQVELSGELLEKLAEAAHEMYCEGLLKRGFSYGPANDEELKTNSALIPYQELTEDFQEQNRQNVRDIPTKLAMIGYIMIPARSNERPFNFPGAPLEQLSIFEHDRFLQSKLADGWTYAPKTDKAKKLNQTLLPWDKLPDIEKEKDRDLVRGIPKILAKAGYAIVKAN